MNTLMPAKEEYLLREKESKTLEKAENQDGVQLVMITGSQQDALKGTIVPSIIQEDSQADVQSAARLVILPLSAIVQSSPRLRMQSGPILPGPMRMMSGMNIHGSQRSMKRLRERKEKGKDLSLKGSPRARMRRDRLLQGQHSLHLRKETDPNPNPNPKHALA